MKCIATFESWDGKFSVDVPFVAPVYTSEQYMWDGAERSASQLGARMKVSYPLSHVRYAPAHFRSTDPGRVDRVDTSAARLRSVSA